MAFKFKKKIIYTNIYSFISLVLIYEIINVLSRNKNILWYYVLCFHLRTQKK